MPTTSINVPDDLLAAAQAKADEEGRSFSNYVSRLIERDLDPQPTPASGN